MKLSKQKLKQIIKEELAQVLIDEGAAFDSGATAMSHEEVIQDKIQMRLDKIALPEEREKVRKMIDQDDFSRESIGSLSEGAQYILHIIRQGLGRGQWD